MVIMVEHRGMWLPGKEAKSVRGVDLRGVLRESVYEYSDYCCGREE